MDHVEVTMDDVMKLCQPNREFALALENVALKRQLEESEQMLLVAQQSDGN